MSATDQAVVLVERKGAAGFLTLNRPAALNALTHDMVRVITAALDAWENDAEVRTVVVHGAGGKAFCAGGDIRQIYEQGKAGRHGEALAFWADEYRLNVRISEYPKPYVSVIDGIVMGGGVGVSLHGSHIVAGDRYLFAMPEVGIGFFPDVGATYALPRLPGRAGTWLAVSGDRIRTGDAVALGLAHGHVPSARLDAFIAALCEGEHPDAALARMKADSAPALTPVDRMTLDACFNEQSVEDILDALDAAAEGGSEFARKTAATMRTKSPTSLAISLKQMQIGGGLDMREAMRTEYRIVTRIVHGHDFYEGVRAVIVDKDNAPKWNPARLEDIDPAAIDAHFAPLGADELDLGQN